MRIVALCSGGLDSAVMLAHLRNQDHEVWPLAVNYGQRHARELVFARDLGAEVAELSALRPLLAGSALTDDVALPLGHYADPSMRVTVVPNRNMLLLAVALARCVALDYDAVAYAAHAGDHTIYPDCRPAFADAMGEAARLCDYRQRLLLRPLIHFSKADIVRQGANLGVDFASTWSCYAGGEVHCGKCGTCVERIEAFRLAGVPDPTDYAA